jgi:hypothetical protein
LEQDKEERPYCVVASGCLPLEKNIDKAKSELYDALEKKVSWNHYIYRGSLILLLITGGYVYTTLSAASVKETLRAENKAQDTRIEDMTDRLKNIDMNVEKIAGAVGVIDKERAYMRGLHNAKKGTGASE